MRILISSHGYPPTVSGVTLVVQKIARAMARRAHQVLVVTGSDRGEPYTGEDEGVQVARVRSWRNPFWKEAPIPGVPRRTLEQIVADFQPSLIHVQDPLPLAAGLVHTAHELNVPLLATCHHVPRFATQYVGGSTVPGAVETVTRRYAAGLLNKCDHVVFATVAHRQLFCDLLSVPTSIISNGVDTERYSRRNGRGAEVAARYGLPAGPIVLFVGRLARDKSIDVLVRAVAALGDLDVHLLIVGRGDQAEPLQELAASLGASERVHLMGFVPEDDMPALYAAADLFAIASTYETQSLPVLQAMAAGLPVVAVDAVALPELVHHRKSGLVVPPANPPAMAEAMRRLLTDRDMAQAMSLAGLDLVRAHDDARTIEAYERLYERLVAGHA